MKRRWMAGLAAVFTMSFSWSQKVAALDLVKDGKPTAVIVVAGAQEEPVAQQAPAARAKGPAAAAP